MPRLFCYFLSAWVTMFPFSFLNAQTPPAVEKEPIFDIRTFGAVGDGETLDTPAIQAAINACAQTGGGRVMIPNGTFLSGTIYLKDHVDLHLAPSAVLKGSPVLTDYPTHPRALIRGDRVNNIAVSGRGTINGNGDHANFRSDDMHNGIKGRPHLIRLTDCTRVKLKEFKALNGAAWNLSLFRCDFVTVDDVHVFAQVVANNDGLDLVDCHDCVVSNCVFDCGDDSICPKSDSQRMVKRLTITNCIVKSQSNAIKFGTASVGGFEDVTISNCVLHDTRLSGIALEVVDGGVMDRIAIHNITMHRVNGSIFVKIGKRKEGQERSALRNVTISNIVADGIGHWEADQESDYFKAPHDARIGVTLAGQPGLPLENITLSNISLQFAGGGTEKDAAAEEFRDLRPKGYPEYHNFGVTPAYGINGRHINNLRLDNITVGLHGDDARAAVMLQDVRTVHLDALKASVTAKAPAFVRLKDAEDIFVTQCKPQASDVPFVAFEGDCRDVSLLNNDFSKLKEIYRSSETVSTAEIKTSGNLAPQ